MRRLALGLPTVLQLDNQPPLLFHEHGVCQFLASDNVLAHRTLASKPPGQIWVLVDSNELVTVPAAVFRGQTFFVVAAVPFSLSRLEWTNRLAVRHFYMKTWAFSEVLQAYVETPLYATNTHISRSRPFLSPGTERQLWFLCEEYGASPRVLAKFACNPLAYNELIVREVISLSPTALHNVLRSPFLLDSPHLLLMDPSPNSRFGLEKRVASRRIAKMLQDKRSK